MTTSEKHPLDALQAELDALPKFCPTWCLDGHEVGVMEGNTGESARTHASGDYGDALATLVNPYTNEILRKGGQSWHVQAEATTHHRNGWQDAAYITLEVTERLTQDASASLLRKVDLKMTPEEVKAMARVLDHLADSVLLADYKPTRRTIGALLS